MRFPLWERLEMALDLGRAHGPGHTRDPRHAPRDPPGGGRRQRHRRWVVGAVFAGLPWLPVTGRGRWRTYTGLALATFGAGSGALSALGTRDPPALAALAITCAVAAGILSVDLEGTTPWYPSTINGFHNEFGIELVEDRCTGAAECVQVCPREVLKMDGRRRKVVLARPEACIRCGACIVQCPEDALQFRFSDGRVVAPASVRSTRLNMLGRRTVPVAAPPAPRS